MTKRQTSTVEPTINQQLGRLLTECRENIGLTQKQVAVLTDVPVWKIGRLENGGNDRPAFEDVARLAALYGVPLDTLAVESGLPNVPPLSANNNDLVLTDQARNMLVHQPAIRAIVEQLARAEPSWAAHVIRTVHILLARHYSTKAD